MKSILITMTCFLLYIGASKANENSPVLIPRPERSYIKTTSRIDSLKHVCRTKSVKQAGESFASYIDKKMLPHWLGTKWDFNGVTQTPGKGNIACGYFVTTVLRDAGVKINRVKMAQCASETMINSLTKNKVNYSQFSFTDFIKKVKAKGKGISIIGLDSHTGFLFNDGKELWFIHSSFVNRKGVVKEKASTNSILYHSKYKVVGFISQDSNFMKRWMRS